jgi:hypothetical protein
MAARKLLLFLGISVVIGLLALALGGLHQEKPGTPWSAPGRSAGSREIAASSSSSPSAGETQPSPATGADPPQHAMQQQPSGDAGAQSPLIVYENGELTLALASYPLQSALREISRKTGLPVFSSAELGNPLVSMQFEKLPLARGLERLLGGYDVFFFHRGGLPGEPSLGAVWVYPEGAGTDIVPVAAAEWASTRELEGKTNDSDPNKRAQAIETLIERQGNDALQLALEALRDSEEVVRYRVLNKALGSGLFLPSGLLLDLLQFDPSLAVRSIALGAIAQDPNSSSQRLKAGAEIAINDPSPELRDLALEILGSLETASRVLDGDQDLQPEGGKGQERLPADSQATN